MIEIGKKEKWLDELMDFVGIPSISSEPEYREEMEKAALWLMTRLKISGAEQIRKRNYHEIPMVTAQITAGDSCSPTLLLYGHYDVQPSGDPDKWLSPPFEPEIRDGNVYGRGMTDMKGQIMALFAALDLISADGGLNYNLKFLFEGAEESNGALLEGFIKENKKELSCDLVLNVDSGMILKDCPTINYGCRGMAAGHLRISGPTKDLHCGEFGGVTLNPVHALCRAISGLHDNEGKVTLNGFYDHLTPAPEWESDLMKSLPLNDEFFLSETGVPALWGESGYSPLERSWIRPVLEVVDIKTGEMPPSISPSAEAFMIFRLVPGQDPQEIHQSLISYLERCIPPAVQWEIRDWGTFPASITDPFSPAAAKLSFALETVWGKTPALARSGGSLPMVSFVKKHLRAETLLTGFQLPEDNMHGPNEKLNIATWDKGISALKIFLQSLEKKDFK